VKASTSDTGFSFRVISGGEFRLSNASVRDLVQLAYALEDFQVTGGPNWANSNWDSSSNPSRAQTRFL